MNSPESSLSEARLRVPARSQHFIRRPRVTALLDEAITHPLTVVIGPAGTGKTLAVADWTREGRPPAPPVWVSLDRSDADPARFWLSLLTAVRLTCGPEALRGLEVPDLPDGRLLAGLAANLGGALVLVFDDVHEIEREGVLTWFDDLLRWPPDGVHLVMVSRHDPPIALARLRLEGKVAEVRFADLQFTRDETDDLLRDWGVHLSEPALDRLTESTGGWVAAVRLATLTLRTAANPSAVIERLGGSTFHVAQYLQDEVLQVLPPRDTEFMLRMSVAGRLCAPLAQALTGEPDADLLLRRLAQEDLLVQELEDSGWYRTHSLMTAVLRARLKADRPDLEQDLHRRAALWFEGRQAWMEALRHAVASGDWEFAGRVALRSAAIAIFTADRAAFVDVLAGVPGDVAHDHPELTLAFAVAAYCNLEDERAAPLLEAARPTLDRLDGTRRGVALMVASFLEASIAHRRGDAAAMLAAAAAANPLLTALSVEDAPGWARHRGVGPAIQGVAELWNGHPDQAARLLREVATAYPMTRFSAYSDSYYLGNLALAQVGMGQLATGLATANKALEAARARGRQRTYEAQWAWLALTIAAHYTGDAAGARDAAAACAEAASVRANAFIGAQLTLMGVRRHLAAGNVGAARGQLSGIVAQIAGTPLAGPFNGIVTSLRVDVELAAGAVERARTILDEYDREASQVPVPQPPQHTQALAACRARLLLAEGRPEDVRASVAAVLEEGGISGVRAWLAVAQAEERLRHDSLAMAALARAVDLAAPECILLPFLRPSPALAAALRRHLELGTQHRAFVEKALATASTGTTEPVRPNRTVEPLTERERSVLAYLPTISSNAEIAAALSISENTVKQHLKSTYRKLGVASRREAVRVAREHGLLPWPGQAQPVTVGES